MKIRFSKKWFNLLYFILNEILQDNTIRIVLCYGCKSSAKTFSIAQILLKELIIGHSSLAYRKESVTIPTTLRHSLNTARKLLFMEDVVNKYDRYFKTSQAEIALKGLDDEEKAKGIESYKYILLDELNQFTFDEFINFNISLRGIEGQKIFGTWNPISDQSWLKIDYIDKIKWLDTKYKLPCDNSFVKISENGKIILIKTTYEDNYWTVGSPDGTFGYRDENLIEEYKQLKLTNYNKYKVNVLGEWGKTEYGGEFLKSWNSAKHTGRYIYNPECAIYLSIDENVNPYFPCGIFQIQPNQKASYLIDIITLANPENTVKKMGREIVRRLMSWGHRGKIYITGDATSQKEDVKQEKGHDLFTLLMIELKEYKPIRLVSKSNPSVIISGNFFNDILENNCFGLEFNVDESCRKAILDFENTKEDKNGKIDKTTVENPITKIRYQPYGHIVDLTRYFLCTIFAKEYLMYQTGQNPHLYKSGHNLSLNNW